MKTTRRTLITTALLLAAVHTASANPDDVTESKLFTDPTWTVGTKRVGVWVPALPAPASFTPAEIQTVMDRDVRDFFARNSFGQLRLDFTVRALTAPFTAEQLCNCEEMEAAAAAERARRSLVYDLEVVVLRCSGASLGSVGDSGTCVRVSDLGPLAWLTEHELGHNLGLQHAAEFNNVRLARYTAAAEQRDYGDSHDRMGQETREAMEGNPGGQLWGLFNAAYTRRLKWIPDGNWRTVPAAARTDAVVRVFAFDQGGLPAAGKAVGVHVAVDADNAAVLSYRVHAPHSVGRLEAHAVPSWDFIYPEDGAHGRGNLERYGQSYIVDFRHDSAGVALCEAIRPQIHGTDKDGPDDGTDDGPDGGPDDGTDDEPDGGPDDGTDGGPNDGPDGGLANDGGQAACQLGLGAGDGPQPLPRSDAAGSVTASPVTVEVVGSGTEGNGQQSRMYIDVKIVRSGGNGAGTSAPTAVPVVPTVAPTMAPTTKPTTPTATPTAMPPTTSRGDLTASPTAATAKPTPEQEPRQPAATTETSSPWSSAAAWGAGAGAGALSLCAVVAVSMQQRKKEAGKASGTAANAENAEAVEVVSTVV